MKKAFIGFGMLVVCVVCVLGWVKLFNIPTDDHTVSKFHSYEYNDKGVLVENERPERYIMACGDTYIIDNDALNWLICEGSTIMSDISDSVRYDE